MSGSSELLRVQGLSYAYGERHAVRDATFSIGEGEIFGFLGPNGAGKTTTIACIAGLFSRWQGKILFHGEPFRPARCPQDRIRLGLVPQDLALYQELKARENLEFFGRLAGLSGSGLVQAVERALALAGLEDRAGDRVDAFSGGMKRRLNLAIGDLHQPELLLLDEPTAGVDPQSRNHLFETLRAIRGSGRTLLYTTHYMEEAERLCDRVGILNDGVLIGIGTPAELAAGAGIPGRNLEEVFLKMTGRSLRDP
ncbi:MAG: ABC transporter ATP-binding protein [Planctomycetota bacterium]